MTTFTDKLRAVADLLDQHPDLPEPYVRVSSSPSALVAWWLTVEGRNDADQKATAASIIRSLGGDWAKQDRDEDLNFRQERSGIEMLIQVRREAVCERVVTGTETVTIPAVEARPERIETRETYEWRCGSLLDDAPIDLVPAEVSA